MRVDVYKPLPEMLTIKESSIHGLGLFSVCTILAGTNLGISHVSHDGFQDGWIRTPLGGFYNHSPDDPNCYKRISRCGTHMYLVAARDIMAGEEITVKYSLYSLG